MTFCDLTDGRTANQDAISGCLKFETTLIKSFQKHESAAWYQCENHGALRDGMRENDVNKFFVYMMSHIASHQSELFNYLNNLKDEYGCPLISHRRNTFVKGLITAAKSIKELAMILLTRTVNPFEYVLTYKFSQDQFELLFS